MSENTTNYMDFLNFEQRKAIENTYGPTLVLAGAGSGKTRVLTFKILHLLLNKLATPSQILAVTFTNKASMEMKKRISDMVNFPTDRMWLGTFHSLSLKILRIHYKICGLKSNFIIIDTEDQLKLIKQICERENINTKEFSPKYYATIIDSYKNKNIFYNDLKKNKFKKNDGNIHRIYKLYQEELLRLNCVDFGDLILFCIKLFESNKQILEQYQKLFKFILVDEYQDINLIQQKWLEYIYKGHKNICCVGDDDQSIYSWRGANVSILLNFEKNFLNSKIFRLEQNYRSTQNILESASSLINKNKGRYGKKLWSQNEKGEKISINGFWETKEESSFVTDKIEELIRNKTPLNEISILFRVSAHTRSFEERLITVGLPYKIIGGLRFYERKEIKDIIAYLRLVNNSSDNLAFERIINTPRRGVGKTTINKINIIAREKNLSMFEASKIFIESSKSKSNQEILNFIQSVVKWKKIKDKFNHIELAQSIIEDSKYIEYLKQEEKTSKNPESLNKIDNINEFVESLKDFDNLEGFLEHVSLIMENITNSSVESISLMTMHSAKGLEFDNIFLAGWEEGVFPSLRSIDEHGKQGLEEERRLAYVALTRARKKIHITYVNQNRYSFATHDFNTPSRFINELPTDMVEINDSSFIGEKDFLEDFVELENISKKYLSPGRKRLLNRQKNQEIEWDINQDLEFQENFNKGDKVFHKKFGHGTILFIEGDIAEVNFKHFSNKKVYIKFLQIIH